MKTNSTQLQAPAVSGGQKFFLAILFLVGAAGTFVAQQELAVLRGELKTLVEGMASGGRQTSVAAGSTAKAASSAPVETVDEAPAASAPTAAASPGMVRTQSLTMLSDLMSQRRIMATGIPLMLGRPGETIPAYAVGPDGKLAPGFGQLYGLSEAEVANLQGTTDQIKQRLDAAIKAAATIESTGTDAYKIESQPVAEAGALRDQFIAAYRSALGDERYRAFAALNGEREIPEAARTRVVDGVTVVNRSGPEAFFDSFGETKRTVTLSKTGGRYSVQIRSGTGSSSSSGAPNLDSIRPRMGALADLLPAGF